MALGHALKDVSQVSEGFDVVELGGSDERAHGGPARATAVGTGEQVVLATEGDRSDCAFNRIIVEVDPAIIEEAQRCGLGFREDAGPYRSLKSRCLRRPSNAIAPGETFRKRSHSVAE